MANGGSSFICTDILGTDMVIYFDYEITYAGRPAKTYGPPENCYDAEPTEFNIKFTGLVEDEPDLENKNPKYLDTPDWLCKIIEEFLYNSDAVYQKVCEHQEDDDNGYEYDEDYYRDR